MDGFRIRISSLGARPLDICLSCYNIISRDVLQSISQIGMTDLDGGEDATKTIVAITTRVPAEESSSIAGLSYAAMIECSEAKGGGGHGSHPTHYGPAYV